MYYVITTSGVQTGKSLGQVNRKLKAKLEETEFTPAGNDRVVKVSGQDIDFIQDKKRISLIPISGLYKSDTTMKYVTLFILVLQFITLIKK